MMPDKRRSHILKISQDQGVISVTELSDRFGVSEMTIRRDLALLHNHGQLKRTHGGAVYLGPSILEEPFAGRADKMVQAKRDIGRTALTLVQEHASIAMDASTTCLAMAKCMVASNKKVLAITNGLYTAIELARQPMISSIVLPGNLRPSSLSLVGPMTEKQIADMRVQTAFISSVAFDLATGASDSDVMEAAIKASMVQAADESILLVDHSKIGKRALVQAVALENLTTLITDAGCPEKLVDEIKEAGLRVLVAGRAA